MKNKPVFKEVVEDIIDFVSKSGYLVSHNNNQFDHPFLEAEFKKANKKLPRGWKFIDTLHLARIAYPELTNFKIFHQILFDPNYKYYYKNFNKNYAA